MNDYKVLLYYKYVNIETPEMIRDDHFSFCPDKDIKGRIFISGEGINGTVSGTTRNIEEYKKFLISYEPFHDITFKEDQASSHAFKKTAGES